LPNEAKSINTFLSLRLNLPTIQSHSKGEGAGQAPMGAVVGSTLAGELTIDQIFHFDSAFVLLIFEQEGGDAINISPCSTNPRNGFIHIGT